MNSFEIGPKVLPWLFPDSIWTDCAKSGTFPPLSQRLSFPRSHPKSVSPVRCRPKGRFWLFCHSSFVELLREVGLGSGNKSETVLVMDSVSSQGCENHGHAPSTRFAVVEISKARRNRLDGVPVAGTNLCVALDALGRGIGRGDRAVLPAGIISHVQFA